MFKYQDTRTLFKCFGLVILTTNRYDLDAGNANNKSEMKYQIRSKRRDAARNVETSIFRTHTKNITFGRTLCASAAPRNDFSFENVALSSMPTVEGIYSL